MKPMKTALMACACAGICGSVLAAQGAGDASPVGDGARAGFFVVPVRPLAYSFADICSLTIEPRPAPVQTAASGALAAPDLADVWTRTAKPQPAAVAAEADPPAGALQPVKDRTPLLAAMPEPADWMQLCGFAIIALIAKRRRDWSVWRGLALGKTMPLRRSDAVR